MSVAFWSVKLTNGKSVEVQPPEGYVLNVQQAAMTGEGHAVVKVDTVSVEGDKISSVICTLRAKATEQCAMNLVFGYDVPVAFSSEGKGEVYLSGYYQPGPEEDDENDLDDYDEDEDSDDDEDDEDDDDEEDGDEETNIKNAEAAIAKLGAGRKNDLVVSGKKVSKAQLQSDSESEDDDEDDDSEDEDDSEGDEEFIKKMIKRNGLEQDGPRSARVEELDAEDSEDDEEEGSEDDSEEESEEEAPPVKVQKTQSKGTVVNQKSNNNTPAQKGNNNSKPNTPANKQQQQQGQKTPQGGKPNGNNNKTPNTGNKPQNSGFKSGDKRKR